MGYAKAVSGLGLLLMLMLGCSGSGMKSADGVFMENMIPQKFELIEPHAIKLWEGDIEGKRVAYFRSKEDSTFRNVVVVTHDDLPDNFRSIQYCDSDGDRSLDLVKIKMYREGEGWKDIRITNRSMNTLDHANGAYHDLLEKIAVMRLKHIDF
jgi:hypothetical protein